MSARDFWHKVDRYLSFYLSPAVKWIIYINTIVLLLMFIVFPLVRLASNPLVLTTVRFGRFFAHTTHLDPTLHEYVLYFCGQVPRYSLLKGFVWQFATYLFLHANGFHLFCNMLGLWFFGPRLERFWGTKNFTIFYFVVGLGAGLFHAVVMYFSGKIGGFDGLVPLIGASGSIFGILLAYALYWPDDVVYFMALFPIRIKWLILIFGGFTFLNSIGPQTGSVSHLTHMGGLLVAFVYLRGWRIVRRKFLDRDPHQRDTYHSRRSRSIFDDNDTWWK